MKIILSRKGFDSANGGMPSPILPDGTLLSMPIPSVYDFENSYSSLSYDGASYYDIIRQLNPRTNINADEYCHLDPDIRENVREREPDWKPAFGQMGGALTELRSNGVSIGDIFLFFGLFKQTEFSNGNLRFKRGAPEQHIIYGYMQVGEIVESKENIPDWLRHHPHAAYKDSWLKSRNAIFIAADTLAMNPELKGAGTLCYRKDRMLTKDGMSSSRWQLPDFFKEVKISHNPDPWKDGYFQAAPIGQEFVMEATPKIVEWASNLIK